MKRILSLILVIALCLSLCACGKSKEVIAVEEKIASIGEISIDSIGGSSFDSQDAIDAARDAYNALSDADKEKVENISVLHDAIFESIVIRCNLLNKQSSVLSDGVIIVWENVGGSKFWDHFDDVLRLTSLDVVEAIAAREGLSAAQLLIWSAGRGIIGDGFGYGEAYYYYTNYTDKDFEYVVSMCMPYANAWSDLLFWEVGLNSDVSQFVKEYKDTNPERANLLREWMLESSMFAEFALEPSGNLADYETKLKEYETMMSRFQKEAEMLK